jgi:putative transposase
VVRRRLRRQGVVVDAITYDSPALRLLTRPGADERLLIRRDPRDLSRIHVFDAALDAYQEVPYRTLSRPPITLWEHREASRALRAAGRAQVDEVTIFATVERMRAVAAEAACQSKAARRRQERLPKMAGAEALRLAPPADGSVEQPVEPYEVEEW